MEFKNVAWSSKQLNRMVDNGLVRFDYPIQRSGGQWKELQKSYLIHSLAQNFPIPPVYFLGDKQDVPVVKKDVVVYENKTVRWVLDGKQRLTVIKDFSEGKFSLHEDTPVVIIEGDEYQIAGKYFNELDEEVVDMILSRTILTYTVDRDMITDDEIEDLFYRMNNGVTLTVQQKSKALMGVTWSTKLNELGNSEFFLEKAAFSKEQLRSEGHHTAILQAMMMLDNGFKFANASQKVISEYATTFKTDNYNKNELFDKITEAVEYLDKSFDKKENLLLKKVNFPMTVLVALKAKESGLSHDKFLEWSLDFKKAYKNSENAVIKTNYNDYTGTGSVSLVKVNGRYNEMLNHFSKYFELVSA
jgi:hypothetical protein